MSALEGLSGPSFFHFPFLLSKGFSLSITLSGQDYRQKGLESSLHVPTLLCTVDVRVCTSTLYGRVPWLPSLQDSAGGGHRPHFCG